MHLLEGPALMCSYDILRRCRKSWYAPSSGHVRAVYAAVLASCFDKHAFLPYWGRTSWIRLVAIAIKLQRAEHMRDFLGTFSSSFDNDV